MSSFFYNLYIIYRFAVNSKYKMKRARRIVQTPPLSVYSDYMYDAEG